MIKLILTLKMTTAQVVKTSVTVNNNSPIQDYIHLDNQTQPTFEMTPGFKPFTIVIYYCRQCNDLMWSHVAVLQQLLLNRLQEIALHRHSLFHRNSVVSSLDASKTENEFLAAMTCHSPQLCQGLLTSTGSK